MTRQLSLVALAALALLVAVAPATPDEEFVGPFPSWRNLKRDFGAKGDGQADDTAAFQHALDELTHHEKACVLFVPAGTYRITSTVKTTRKAHTDCQGVSLLGADPERTRLLWDGPDGGTMLGWDAWYSRIGRLTFDGAGRAGTGLLYGPAFSTYNESSDLVFRDLKHGLVFGGPDTAGQAENAVLRCRFLRCGTGIQTVNFNSMDIWAWYCRFEDCDQGIFNVMGNWHAWHNLFLRSRTADLATQNLMVFSVVNNTSVAARRFFDFSSGHTWGSPVTLSGNRVLDPTGDFAIVLDNAGPYLLVDNVVRTRGATRAVRMTWGDQALVANTYTRPDAVAERGRFRRVGERVVEPSTIADELPDLPPPPPRVSRPVIEVAAGSDATALQRAIDEAAEKAGQRPVVHLPMGAYPVARTLVVPSGCGVQIVGDGAGETATRLNWTGPEGGVILRLEGPSRAVVRDLYLHAPNARGLVVDDADQPGGHIFADQLNTSGPSGAQAGRTTALRVRGLDRTDVLLRSLQGSGNAGAWVVVEGGPKAATSKSQVAVLTGATGSAAGQYEVCQGGRLVVRGVYHERSSGSVEGLRLDDRGTLSIDATRFSYATSPQAPTVALDSFRGLFTLATSLLLPVETKTTCRIEVRGDGSAARVLALENQFWVLERGTTADTVWRNLARPPARGGLVGCNVNTSVKGAAPNGFALLANVGDHPDPARSRTGAGPLDDRGTVDDAAILDHLAPLRECRVWLPGPVPPGITDVRIHRVMVSGGRDAVVEFRAGH
jgi:Pectate lyase superfamily protein